jgi:hypothetical protein
VRQLPHSLELLQEMDNTLSSKACLGSCQIHHGKDHLFHPKASLAENMEMKKGSQSSTIERARKLK